MTDYTMYLDNAADSIFLLFPTPFPGQLFFFTENALSCYRRGCWCHRFSHYYGVECLIVICPSPPPQKKTLNLNQKLSMYDHSQPHSSIWNIYHDHYCFAGWSDSSLMEWVKAPMRSFCCAFQRKKTTTLHLQYQPEGGAESPDSLLNLFNQTCTMHFWEIHTAYVSLSLWRPKIDFHSNSYP